jgi:hypothetical protein
VSVAKPVPAPEVSSGGVEGAKAFVRYYNEVLNYAYATGDTEELQRLSAPGCAACQLSINSVRRFNANGGHVEGGWRAVLSAELPGRPAGPNFQLLVTTSVTEGRVVNRTGQVIHQEPAFKIRNSTWIVSRESTAWIVKSFRAVQS